MKLPAILLTLILLLASGFAATQLNRPFERDSEGCGSFFALLARNYFRYGLSVSRGVPIMSMGQGAEAEFYANHPPTTPLLIAAVYGLSGYRGAFGPILPEWQTRLPTFLFLLGSIIAIYQIVRRRAGPRAGLIAAALLATIPMSLMYGGFPDVINPQLVFFAMLTVAAYERFHESPNRRNFGWLCLAFLGAGIMDWPAYQLVPVLGLHYILTRRQPRQWGWIIGFGAFASVLFGALYVYLAMAHPLSSGGHDWFWMKNLVARRAMSNVADNRIFGFADWWRHAVWQFAIGRHTLIATLLALTWLVFASLRRFSGRADRFCGLLLAWAALHILVGRQGVFQHEWWWWPLTPGLVIAAALALDQILTTIEQRLNVPQRTMNVITALALLVFGIYNARAVVIERANVPIVAKNDPSLNYSPREFGQVIREFVPPDEAVLVAESDESLAFWAYADRAVKRNVWDVQTMQKRMNDGWADLCFEWFERWDRPAAAMIVPKAYAPLTPAPLLNYLNANYPLIQTGKFLIYDLRHPLKPPASTSAAPSP